jgi:hypothetical protein
MMSRKINSQDLKKIIREQIRSVLLEETVKKELQDSLDQQVDDFLISYESDAKVKKNEGFDFRSMTRSFLSTTSRNLLEAEGDEEEEKPADEAGDEEKPEEKKKLSAEDIDIEEFASSVVRLIDNYDSLLEVRNTLARRAMNFLSDNYSQDVVTQFKIVLEDEHDITVGKSKAEEEDNEFPTPVAAGAGSGGGGAV